MVCNTYLDETQEWWWSSEWSWPSKPRGCPELGQLSLPDPSLQTSQPPPHFLTHWNLRPLPLLLFLIKISKILIENYAISDIIADTDFSHQVMQWPWRHGNWVAVGSAVLRTMIRVPVPWDLFTMPASTAREEPHQVHHLCALILELHNIYFAKQWVNPTPSSMITPISFICMH